MKKGKTKKLKRVKKNKNLYQQLEKKKQRGVQKRLYFKRWIEILLWIALFGSLFVISSECSNTSMFLKSKLIAIIIFSISSYLLNKYSRLINK